MGDMADDIIEQVWNQPHIHFLNETPYNPNYYHQRIGFTALNSISEKQFAVNINLSSEIIQLEIPKKICREIDYKQKTMLVHTEIFEKILRQKQLDDKNGIGTF